MRHPENGRDHVPMAWTLTADVGEYLTVAGPFLRTNAAEHTTIINAAEVVRLRGAGAYGDSPPLFGWWCERGSEPAAAFLHTPPYPVTFTLLAEPAAAELAEVLARLGRPLSGANADPVSAMVFATCWRARTAEEFTVTMRTRLYRLDSLRAPDPLPEGRARVASGPDRLLVLEWLERFQREAGAGEPSGVARAVDDRLSYGGITLWEGDDGPVSLAGMTRPVAGQVRVGPVYTPPRWRGRGFGAAATAAVSQAALDTGARDVVLFTDVANPVSNALYQRLGYRAIGDRVALGFVPPPP